VTVFNLSGQSVRELIHGPYPQGDHSILFDGSHLPSGMYFVQL